MTEKPKHPSVMRTLGLTLGDLWSVVRTGKPRQTATRVVRKQVEEDSTETPQGQVTLRRTVIEEMEVRPPPNPPQPPETP